MQQPRNTTKLYRLPPNVIYFLFYCKSNLFFIFLNKNKRKMIYKNIISFTILYFTDVFKRHFENVFLPHERCQHPYQCSYHF